MKTPTSRISRAPSNFTNIAMNAPWSGEICINAYGIAAVSCAVLVVSPTAARMFAAYGGGSGLLLGAVPWVFLLTLRLGPDTLLRAGLLGVVFLAGFFLKSAFLTAALASCAALALLGATESSASPQERIVFEYFACFGPSSVRSRS